MGQVLKLPVFYDPDKLAPQKPFTCNYSLIPYSSIQPILIWCWHDVYYIPNRCRVFLAHLLHFRKKGHSDYKHPALASILEEMKDCQRIAREENAATGKWLVIQDRGDILVPHNIIEWCAKRSCPRYALAFALICCSQMRRVREYRFAINQSWMANRLNVSQATISRLVKDMLRDGLLDRVGKAGKKKNGEIYRWACSNYGKKKPEASADNTIRFQLPATGEKLELLRKAVR